VGSAQYGGNLLTVTLALFCILDGIRGICVLFAFAQGWMRLLATTSLFQGIANFGLGFLLGKLLGLGGITLALSVVALPQFCLLLRKIDKTFSVGIIPRLGEIVLRLVLPLATAAVMGKLVHSRIRIAEHHFTGLLLECVTFFVVYCSVAYPLALCRQDRVDVRRYVGSALLMGKRIGQQLGGRANVA
jgi:hypothetical protein